MLGNIAVAQEEEGGFLSLAKMENLLPIFQPQYHWRKENQ